MLIRNKRRHKEGGFLKGFVIYLSTEIEGYPLSNNYGYWTGKTYRNEDIVYPGWEDDKNNENVKIYKSRKRAESMNEKIRERFTFVQSSRVEEI